MATLSIKSLKLDKVPTGPGIYFFLGAQGRVLYIGKAANLKARLRSYFSPARSDRWERLVKESYRLKIISTGSEIAALLQEAKFIKKLRPKYNVLWRDDKNYFFVGFTREKFPKVFLTHQPKTGFKARGNRAVFFGPFVSGRALKNTLRLLRQSFPYCTCLKPHHRKCLSSQLGLCPGFCCEVRANFTPADEKRYRANIKRIRLVLSGKAKILEKKLKKEIGEAANRADFESALRLRQQLESLEKIFHHRGLLEVFWSPAKDEPEVIFQSLGKILGVEPLEKLEMYDVSMLSGTNAVGAMVVFSRGIPEKGSWRLFKIRGRARGNDPKMIAELIRRRFRHQEWRFPDFILVDGGKGQLAAARKVLRRLKLNIPSGAIAKGKSRRQDSLFTGRAKQISLKSLPRQEALFLKKIRDETHRFVISFHRKRRTKSIVLS